MTQAIHSPPDEAFILDRTRVCLKLFYDPDMDPQDRADMLDSFARALRQWPKWAVARAFDEWERTRNRRPSPAEIGILAGNAVKELSDELARRAPKPQDPPREVDREAANEIMARAGFTPQRMDAIRKAPMATTFAAAQEKVDKPAMLHWSDTAPPDDPAWQQLRASRIKAGMIRE